jgi:hypothetical protein
VAPLENADNRLNYIPPSYNLQYLCQLSSGEGGFLSVSDCHFKTTGVAKIGQEKSATNFAGIRTQ